MFCYSLELICIWQAHLCPCPSFQEIFRITEIKCLQGKPVRWDWKPFTRREARHTFQETQELDKDTGGFCFLVSPTLQ